MKCMPTMRMSWLYSPRFHCKPFANVMMSCRRAAFNWCEIAWTASWIIVICNCVHNLPDRLYDYIAPVVTTLNGTSPNFVYMHTRLTWYTINGLCVYIRTTAIASGAYPFSFDRNSTGKFKCFSSLIALNAKLQRTMAAKLQVQPLRVTPKVFYV